MTKTCGRVLAMVGVVAWAVVGVGCAASTDPITQEDEVRSEVPEAAEVKVVLANVDFDPSSLGAKAERRDITFYDTPELALWSKGLLLRSRVPEGEAKGDVTVKLRPMTPSKVRRSFFDEDGFKCELDANAGSAGTPSCSLTTDTKAKAITAAARDASKIEQLWTEDALAFAGHVAEKLPFEDMRAFGPIRSTAWDVEARELGETVTFERWDVPGGEPTLEASIKIKTQNQAAKEKALLTWLEERGLARATTQKTKTAAALDVLSKAVSGTP